MSETSRAADGLLLLRGLVPDDDGAPVLLVGLADNGTGDAPDQGPDRRPDAGHHAPHDRAAHSPGDGTAGLFAVTISARDHDGLPPRENFLDDGFTFDDAIRRSRTSGRWSPSDDRP